MKFVADLHIHSHFSIATSSKLIPEYLDLWARIKGLRVVGTGDFTHPGWLKELEQKLEPAEAGLYRLKESFSVDSLTEMPVTNDEPISFLLSAEISSIYKKRDKVRKVHNLICVPDFSSARRIQEKLAAIGNIESDGRPILGLDSRNLLEIALESCPEVLFIPAHIWTPWFSALGDKSGFNSIEECYDDLSEYIYAVETGLSSDPPMNRICSFLDRYTLVSNSDAHSPENLGREANLFDTDVSFPGITEALRERNSGGYLGTIEFFPQEGKYHYDGHRKCGVRWNPFESLEHGGICPVCGKKVTVGVLSRVAQLADRSSLSQSELSADFFSLIPLKEILSEIMAVGKGSKKVELEYRKLISKAGTELNLLLFLPLEQIEKMADEFLYEAIRRMRQREVYIEEGFDGEYGSVKAFISAPGIFSAGQRELLSDSGNSHGGTGAIASSAPLVSFNISSYQCLKREKAAGNFPLKKKPPENDEAAAQMPLFIAETAAETADKGRPDAPTAPFYGSTAIETLDSLNPEQRAAATYVQGPLLIVAGPGTGKTRTLALRIAYLIEQKGVDPEQILGLTFTNKAAGEMSDRISSIGVDPRKAARITSSTFHAFGYMIISDYCERFGRNRPFSIVSDREKQAIISELDILPGRRKGLLALISRMKQEIRRRDDGTATEAENALLEAYEAALQEYNAFDLDDLVLLPYRLLAADSTLLDLYQKRFRWILVDEYQDINHAQYCLIQLIASREESNLCVIGDPDQAIYGFRGADSRFLQTFFDDYPGAAVFNLKKSYRCTNTILKASGQVLRGSADGIFLSGIESDLRVKIAEFASDRSEAEFVARTIEDMMGGLRFFSMDSGVSSGHVIDAVSSLGEIAVLCRIGRQMQVIEKAFLDHSIPYQRVGDASPFQKEPGASIVDCLRLALNPANAPLKRILQKKVEFTDAVLDECMSLKGAAVSEIIVRLSEKLGLADDENNRKSLDNLAASASAYGADAAAFLKSVDLHISGDVYKASVERVSLMTLHASKGLEFSAVFIVGLEDGVIPYSLQLHDPPDRAEERRLLYVGMTRAKRYLFLSYVKKRMLFGQTRNLPRSPFLDAIERDMYENIESKPKRMPESTQFELFS